MRKAPTVSATPAKTRRKVLTKESAWSMRVEALAAVASPVVASYPLGSTRATAARSWSWLVPGAAVTQTVDHASLPSR